MDVVACCSPAAPRRARPVRHLALTLAMLIQFVAAQSAFAQAQGLALLDINTASVAELAERLPGIGAVKAQAIVDWRTANGPFDSIDALLQVPGIGPKTLENLRPLVTVGAVLGEAAAARERATVLAVQRIVERARSAAADSRQVLP